MPDSAFAVARARGKRHSDESVTLCEGCATLRHERIRLLNTDVHADGLAVPASSFKAVCRGRVAACRVKPESDCRPAVKENSRLSASCVTPTACDPCDMD